MATTTFFNTEGMRHYVNALKITQTVDSQLQKFQAQNARALRQCLKDSKN